MNALPNANASVSDTDTSALTEIAEDYFQQRANMLTSNAPTDRFAATPVKTTRTMAAETQDDLAALIAKGDRYQEVDGGYTKAQVDVSLTESTVSGQKATLRLTEHTRLYLPFTQEEIDDGAPEYEEESLPHTVTFTKAEDGSWLLASDEADVEAGGPTPTTQVSAVDVEPETTDGGGKADEDEGSKEGSSSTTPTGGTETGSGLVKPAATASYNYSKMEHYANQYWDDHNPAFRTYSGNDCTNFLSQIMRAGGWHNAGVSIAQRSSNKVWFYGSSAITTSYTWGGAENWYWFAVKHSKRTKVLRSVWDMLTTDVLQADWNRNGVIDHSMFVTKKYRGVPYLTYHTTDTHNKSLKKILSDAPRAFYYAHRT
ncbi:amidase domain-containing protein [Streptomyces nogalater]